MGRNFDDRQTADYFTRPERGDVRRTALDRMVWNLSGFVIGPSRVYASGLAGIAAAVEKHEHGLKEKGDGALQEIAGSLRYKLRRQGFDKDTVAEAFALIREVSDRVLGMRHFDCQFIAGYALLKGFLAEMDTGEGKTLVATLPAATAALAGLPVHVITVNDYLTSRDAEGMGELYRFLGLSVGCIVHEKTTGQRRAAYGCDITYCTNKELVFDYLRDRIALGNRTDAVRLHAEHLYDRQGKWNRLLLRGLHFAIVDEADSVLVDEARTPLIISKTEKSEEENTAIRQALVVADGMREGEDFQIKYETDDGLRIVVITDRGREKIQKTTKSLGPLWKSSVRREELTRKALTALHLFHQDEQYLIRDGKVQIIDEFTGRVMPDRSWEGGLHQLMEVKEGLEMTGQRETMARISYQRFFRKYLRISGMTGTAREIRRELWSVYGLPFVRIPTNKPVRRVCHPERVYLSADEKWQQIIERIKEIHHNGLPVLIGTRTVLASEHLSGLLAAAGIPHQVLNAKQDQEEALIIARAGEAGRITIATNMAGRGTDIKLSPGIAEKGGLHVIMTELHESSRIDRQLAGRCARQGDPGSYEPFLSLEDQIFKGGFKGIPGRMLTWSKGQEPGLGRSIRIYVMKRAQKKVEKAHAGVRKRLIRYDEEQGDTLAFSGRGE